MEEKRRKIIRNRGKVEFIAHFEAVQSLLASGYNLTNVHAMLTEKNLFSMSYHAFCYHLKKWRKEWEEHKKEKPVMTPKIPLVTPSSAKVTRPEDIDHRTLF
jgi:hypothetical protein